MARLTWILPKKRGVRRTASNLAGRVGEAIFFLALFLFGCAGLIIFAWSSVTSRWPVATYFPTASYRAAEGVVLATSLEELEATAAGQPPQFQPIARVTLSIAGQEHKVDAVIAEPTTDRAAASAALAGIQPGAALRCWYDPQQPARVIGYPPSRRGLWLSLMLLLVLAGAGAYGVIYTALHVRASAERRAAIAKAASAPLRAVEAEAGAAAVNAFPTVPSDIDLVNSPGVRLKYRLPATPESAWRLFGAAIWMLTCGAMAAALLAVAVERHVAGYPQWFLSGFAGLVALLAAWAVGAFLHELVRASWIGPTSVEVSDLPLFPGGTYTIAISQPGALSVRRLRILLACDEETTYLQGTDIRRDVQRVQQQELCSREGIEIDAAAALEESCTLTIPPSAMHSFRSRFNLVSWKLIVEMDAEGWPPYRRSFPLIVYPAQA